MTYGDPHSSGAHDANGHARQLRATFEAVLAGERAAQPPRQVVSASWERSLAARVDPEHRAPAVVIAEDELSDRREHHPLSAVMPLLQSTLVSIADDAMHVMLVTDADGHILWRDGASKLFAVADDVGLLPGTRWTEEAIGTNAMGTALAVDGPVRIHSAEHLVRTYHAWTCAAAPVHDPDTGAILGAIDISGPLHTVHPAMAQLVVATAQLAENQLRVRMAIADERMRVRNMPHLQSLHGHAGALVTPTGRIVAGEPYGVWPDRVVVEPGSDRVWLDDGREMLIEPLAEGYLLRAPMRMSVPARRSALSLRLTGEQPPRALLDGMPVPLTLRPAELLAVLALHPEGLTAERLALLLYGEEGNPTTVRGEIRRLRSQIGTTVLRTRPYRLDAEVDSDFAAVRRALRTGRPAEALRACTGPLLPRSDAPEIRQLRDELDAGVRRAVLTSDDAELVAEYCAHPLGHDDLEAHELALALLPVSDQRVAPLEARTRVLVAEQ